MKIIINTDTMTRAEIAAIVARAELITDGSRLAWTPSSFLAAFDCYPWRPQGPWACGPPSRSKGRRASSPSRASASASRSDSGIRERSLRGSGTGAGGCR